MNLSPRQIQITLTVGLVAVLALIIGGYIYIGMHYAKEQEQVPAVEEATTTPSRRDEILEALKDTPPTDPAKREEILNSLDAAPASTADPERRQQILDALNTTEAAQ